MGYSLIFLQTLELLVFLEELQNMDAYTSGALGLNHSTGLYQCPELILRKLLLWTHYCT